MKIPRSLFLAGLPFLASATTTKRDHGNDNAQGDDSCRCLPGDSCWPSTDEWENLNKTVDGRLIATIPLGSPCHDPNYDEAACDKLKDAWTLPQTHLHSSSSVMQGFFGNRTCSPFLDQSKPCTLGNIVHYAVNVTTPEHVASTIKFAKDNNIRLVVRNTGHDYFGKSTGAGGLAVWTQGLKDTKIIPHKSNNYCGPALKAGAGIWGTEAVEFAAAHNLTVLTGDCPTVGLAGGFTQGGGHSALSTRFGLAADQTLEFEVVTADGDIVKASSTENSDLYWALSGGGGGTFGVVTSITVRAHPNLKVGGASVAVSAKYTTPEKFNELVARFHTAVPSMAENGAAFSWYVAAPVLFINPVTVYNSTGEYVKHTVLAPITKALAELEIPAEVKTSTLPYSDHYAAYMGPLPYGHLAVQSYQFGGRLIPRTLLENDPSSFSSVISNLTSQGLLILGSAGTFHAPRGVTNAVLPAWRDASIALQLTTAWDVTRWEDMITDQFKMRDDWVAQLEELTPGGGAYLNEANFRQEDWQEVFFGENYGRLRDVKRRWDPDGVFYALKGVGSEEWEVAEDGRMCKAA